MDRKFPAATFEADSIDHVAATQDQRIAQFTFKDTYGNTLTIQMDDELGAHFVATCQKILVSKMFERRGNVGTSMEERRAWPSKSLSRLTNATAAVSGIPPQDKVHLRLDRGLPYELNYEVEPDLAEQLSENLREVSLQVRSRPPSRED